jgi:serine/threonine-protein kinase
MPATTLAYDLAEAPAAGAGAGGTGVAAAAGVEAAFAARALGGRYQLVRELGRGATGVVLLARDRLLHRAVALKVLHLELARSAAARERFRREARILAQLPAHPGVVPCLGYDEVPLPGGSVACCLAMPYLAGDTLADRVAERGRLPWAETAAVLAALAEALAHAHAHGVVHRDLKPENVLLARPGAPAAGGVLLTDFGVAARPSHDDPRAADHSAGTPRYMAPEQFAGDHAVDPRSDMYALGALGYHLLAGRPPFDGRHAGALAVQHCTAPLPPLGPLAPYAPAPLVAAIERCLAKDPGARWPNAGALAAALPRGGRPGAHRRPRAGRVGPRAPARVVVARRPRRRPPRRRLSAPARRPNAARASARPASPAAMPLFAPRPAAVAPAELAPGAPLLSLRDVEKTLDAGGVRHYLLRRISLDVRPASS